MILSLNHSRTGRDLRRAEGKIISCPCYGLRYRLLYNYLTASPSAWDEHFARRGWRK
jgi:hypothetical protein